MLVGIVLVTSVVDVASLVCVDCGTSDAVALMSGAGNTFTCTQIWPFADAPSPNCFPVLSSNDQLPLYVPGMAGAVKSMEMSMVSSGATVFGSVNDSTASILSPPIKINL